MSRVVNWERALHEFLVSAFTADELRRWCYYNCRGIADVLPPAPADVESVAFSFVTSAQKHGLLDEELFEQLAAHRSNRRAEVEAIRQVWPGQAKPVTRVTQASTGVVPRPKLDPSHTAITLDRISQWGGILKACADPEHLLVLVHGDREQDLHLFLERIKTYVDKECPRRHHEYVVELGRDHSAAVTAEDWMRQVCLATPMQTPDLAAALGQATRAMAGLFVLEDAGKPLRGLSGEHFTGFAGFFAEKLPAALTRQAPANPVRFVLSIEHTDDGQAVREVLGQLAWQVKGANGIRVLPVEELRFPTLEEVHMQLHRDYPDLDKSTWEACERIYGEVTDRRKNFRRTLQDLADPLHSVLATFVAQQAASRRG